MEQEIKVGRYVIELSKQDKVLFPKAKVTKGDIVDYYYEIGPTMLPYVKNRPISMVRYPNGITKEGFYHKDTPAYFPSWIKREPIKRSDGKIINYAVINNNATLVYLANQGCITPHTWLSKIDKLHYPDRMIFDLDPSGKKFDFNRVRHVAITIKKLLEHIGLVPFVMTTGSKGLHVVVPLIRRHKFDYVRAFARDIAEFLVELDPKHLTIEMRKNARAKRIFLDYLRNAYTATSVAPYAVRPRPGATVATPIDWKEVNDSKLLSTRYTYKTVLTRLKKKGDPWKDITKHARSLTEPRKEFDRIIKKNDFEFE